MKQWRVLSATVIGGAAVLASVGAARAQMSPDLIMETYNNNVNAIITSHINSIQIDNIVRGKAHHSNSGGRKGGTRPGTSANGSAKEIAGVSTSYTPSPAITQSLRDDLVAKVRAKSPKDGDAVEQVFKQHNFVTVWQGIVAPYGLKKNDVADAMAAYLVLGWMQANGAKDVTPAQARGVREQMKAAMARTPSFARAAASDRQRMAESLMLEFVLRQGAAQQADKSGNAAQVQQLAQTYQAQVQRTLGLNLRGLALTDNGFRSKT